MKIQFLGGASTVTGSKFLVTDEDTKVLIDCGMFQGLKQLRLLNWEDINVDAHKIDAIFLTHAHLDHCGALPLIVRQGFRGPIYCTAATQEISKVVLLDAAKIQVEEADYANLKRFSKHHPAKPLFDIEEAEKVFPLFKTIALDQTVHVNSLQIRFESSGHILGAASAYVSNGKTTMLFSGDLGRYIDPIMSPPARPQNADVVIMESTYGDRLHAHQKSSALLTELINDAWRRKSVLLIPAFALGRSQNLIYEIHLLKKQGKIPNEIPVYLNSPMGQEICDIYRDFLPPGDLQIDFAASLKTIHFVRTAEESKDLNRGAGPCVIIAASGMLTGGRVLHHLKAFGENSNNTILLAGFQAAGTRGWALAHEQRKIKLHGEYIDIKARIINSDSFSAHADQSELLKWLAQMPHPAEKIFLIHGEPSAADDLRKILQEKYNVPVLVPILNALYTIN
ncbi:MBL fold metallo-hydrolase RNA specificity domain-containing protein [Bdellovibrio sp. NC01]|uniref:MBL fold metallo-hydrolase RNA specificity domain-containing protein n=1 Tax=Bdellovibrio sp. NC01 TaxID=2220073 RepID=UPI00115B67A8|nr:MBL fold metallo-hydrolase [Bdellovibrio sp. NC01]QDK36460.1 MBL fold metallo-hydrolase [Bdellovibrio sp. NC01]